MAAILPCFAQTSTNLLWKKTGGVNHRLTEQLSTADEGAQGPERNGQPKWLTNLLMLNGRLFSTSRYKNST